MSVTIKTLLLIALSCFTQEIYCTELSVEHAWVKLAPPGVEAHAAYMRLTNKNKTPATVTHISADAYEQVVIHKTSLVKDKVGMDIVKTLAIPAEASVVFALGATHLMLMKPHQLQKINDQVKITLIFNDGTQQQFIAQVRESRD